jgi:hypothetical protein
MMEHVMDRRFIALLKVANPNWAAVREVAGLLLERVGDVPSCNFESLCAAVTLWGKHVDPLDVARYLGGTDVPVQKARLQIAKWCKEQIGIIRAREENMPVSSELKRIDRPHDSVAGSDADQVRVSKAPSGETITALRQNATLNLSDAQPRQLELSQ